MYAEVKGWAVVRVYDLSGVSGKTVWDHPEARAMREDIASGRVRALIFSKLARLARNTRELLDFADFFREHDAGLVSLQEAIDTSTPAGRLFYTMVAAMAQWEREEIAERVKVSVTTRAKLGKSLGGAAPYGYRWEDKELVLDETEAPVRALIYELFLEKRRIKTVADELNRRGHRTRRGAKFSGTTVRRLLKDPIAKGERRVNYTRSTGEGKHWEVKPEAEWETTEVPAIITEADFEQVQSILAGISAGRKPSKRVTYLFSGLVFCHCGTKMYRPSNMKKYYCRGCLNKLPEADMETVFASELKRFFYDPEEIATELAKAAGRIEEKRSLLRSMTEERRELQRQMDQLFQLYLDGGLDSAGFGERNRPLEARRRGIDEELPRLQGEIDALEIDQASAETVVSEAQSIYSAWPELTFEEKRAIVETIVDRIEVGDDAINIHLAYVPVSSSEDQSPGKAAREGDRQPHPPEAVVKGGRMNARAATPATRPGRASARRGRSSATSPRSAGRSSTGSTSTSRSRPSRSRPSAGGRTPSRARPSAGASWPPGTGRRRGSRGPRAAIATPS